MNAKVSIIIIRNNTDILNLISSLKRQLYDNIEIIIIDNCSIDKLSLEQDITYVYINEVTEDAILKNYALTLIHGEFVLFADDNIIYTDDNFIADALYSIKDKDAILYNENINDDLSFSYLCDNNFFKKQNEFLSGCIISVNAFKKIPMFFEQYYAYNENLKFICNLLSHEVLIACKALNIYYVNSVKSYKYPHIKAKVFNRIVKLYSKNDVISELSVVIIGFNENVEIEKTVQSVRATSKNFIPIILVDDCSIDGYDYESVADIYNCEFYPMKERVGSSICKNFGVSKVKTKYFLILDGHMRFYYDDWDEYMINVGLSKYPKALFCCQCFEYTKRVDNGMHIYDKEYQDKSFQVSSGAFFSIGTKNMQVHAWWGARQFAGANTYKDVMPISCIMGASYCGTKKWWDYIHGLNGLRGYGNEELFLSSKSWMAGGTCMTFKHVAIGHYAKTYYSYAYNYNLSYYTSYYIMKVLGDDNLFNWYCQYNEKYNKHYLKQWIDLLDCDDVKNEQKYIQSISIRDFKWVLQEINGRVLNSDNNNEYCGRNAWYETPYPLYFNEEYYTNNPLNLDMILDCAKQDIP